MVRGFIIGVLCGIEEKIRFRRGEQRNRVLGKKLGFSGSHGETEFWGKNYVSARRTEKLSFQEKTKFHVLCSYLMMLVSRAPL